MGSGPGFGPISGFWTWIWVYFKGSEPGFGHISGPGPVFGLFLGSEPGFRPISGVLALDLDLFRGSWPGFEAILGFWAGIWAYFGVLGPFLGSKKGILANFGGFDPGFEGSQILDFDLLDLDMDNIGPIRSLSQGLGRFWFIHLTLGPISRLSQDFGLL